MNTKNPRLMLEDAIEENALRAEALVQEAEARLAYFYADLASDILDALDHEEDALCEQGDTEVDQLIQSMQARPAGKGAVPDSEFRTLTLDEYATAVATMRKQAGF